MLPKFHFERASDGKKIYDYYELTADEVLKDQKSHHRIVDDWETDHYLEKYSYCVLEQRSFLDLPYRAYQFTETDKAMLSSPFPKNPTEDELKALLSSWFRLLNSWLFGNTLSGTALIVENGSLKGAEEGLEGIYIDKTETIKLYHHSTVELQIGTLLHEMVHAFVHQYSCQNRCCIPLNLAALGGEGKCEHGHGPAWADCIVHLSSILQQTVDWEVDVGTIDSVKLSMCHERYQPNKEQLER